MDEQNRENQYVDDGHVVAPMNVEGMPWYDRAERKLQRKKEKSKTPPPPPLSDREARDLTKQMLFTLLIVVGIFGGIYALVIWLMTVLW